MIAYHLNNLFLLGSQILVFFMKGGFACLEAGSCRVSSAVAVIFKNYFVMAIAVVCWLLGSFALAFPEGAPDAVARLNFLGFQAMFAATAATICSGMAAERIRLVAFCIFSAVFAAAVYPFIVRLTWGGGWLGQQGYVDFAGSGVVHMAGAFVGLPLIVMLGSRLRRFGDNAHAFVPHCLKFVALGTTVLWLGWFGFNVGSNVVADGDAMAAIAMSTMAAPCAGFLVAALLTACFTRRIEFSLCLNGALGGLVSITAGCDAIGPQAALMAGAIGGAIVCAGAYLLELLEVDDVVCAFPVHGFCGVWGVLAPCVFAGAAWEPQLIGIAVIGAIALGYGVVMSLALDCTIGLRVSAEDEEKGLDRADFGVSACNPVALAEREN